MTAKVITGKTGNFYGWFTLAGLMLVVFSVSGAFVNSFGVFLPVISNEFGWSRATVAMALSMGIVAFGLPSPLFGIFVARFGPRFTIILGNLVTGLAVAGMALVHEAWQVYLLYIVMGAGGGFGGYIACTTVATNWFVKKRSLALGLFTACGSLGGFVFPPLTTVLIATIGWRMSWLVLAAIVVLLAVLLGGVWLIRNKPEDIGQVPDGTAGGFEVATAGGPASLEKPGQAGVPMTQIIRQRSAWLIAAFAAANAFALGTMSAHQVAYLMDIGFSPLTAATTMSLMSAMSVMGSVTLGLLALRINVRNLAIAGFASELIAVTVLLTTRQLGFVYLYAALLGIGNGALSTAMPTFVGLHYHRESYARAISVILPFQVVSQAVAAYIGGLIYDAAATYRPAFFVVAAFIALGMVLVSLARLPDRIDRNRPLKS